MLDIYPTSVTNIRPNFYVKGNENVVIINPDIDSATTTTKTRKQLIYFAVGLYQNLFQKS